MNTFIRFCILILLILWGNELIHAQTTQEYSTPGSHTFVVPAGVTEITIECWGAGGCGGRATSTTRTAGGGGGAYSKTTNLSVSPGNTLYVTVGAGGDGTSATPATGGDSWIRINLNVPPDNTTQGVLAKGGGSVANSSSSGASGGNKDDGIGTIRYSGGNGANQMTTNAAGGGSSAGTGQDGNSATTATGATAPAGGGKGGNGSNTAGVAGLPGDQPGGGGGGSRKSLSTANGNGGDGGHGKVVLTYTVQSSAPPTLNAQYNGEESKTICLGESHALTANPSGGFGCSGSWEYAWFTGDGTGSTYWNGSTWNNAETWGAYATINNVAPSSTTTYKVKVRCSNNYSLNGADNTGVTVMVNSIPSAPTAGYNNPVCEGQTLTLSASTINGATYAWTGPNNFTAAVQNPTVSTNATQAMAGTYYVTATVNGCQSSQGSVLVEICIPVYDLIVSASHTVTANAAYDNVIIEPSGSLTVQTGITLTVNEDFTIESDENGTGSFIQQGNSILNVAGTTTVQKYMPYYVPGTSTQTLGWYFTPPVANASNTLFASSLGLYHFWVHQQANPNGSWSTSITNLMAGKGYVTRYNQNQTVEFSFSGSNDNINNGFVKCDTLWRSGFESGNFGWNLVGNPYPSGIDWESPDIIKDNLFDAIYTRKANGAIATYINGVGTNGGSRYIAPMQAFWVKVYGDQGTPVDTGYLSFNNNTRVHLANNNLLKLSQNPNELRLSINRESYADESVIRFVGGATNNFDRNFDAEKLYTDNTDIPQLYSFNGDMELAINSLPELTENKTVALGFNTTHAGEHSLTTSNLSNFDSHINVYLEDTYTTAVYNLRQQSNIIFGTAEGTFNDRFVVHFMLNSSDANMLLTEGMDCVIYAYNNKLYIQNPYEQANLRMYNTLGQELLQREILHGLSVLNLDLPVGTYLVNVISGSAVKTEKVLIK
jgi:hypothetical protein